MRKSRRYTTEKNIDSCEEIWENKNGFFDEEPQFSYEIRKDRNNRKFLLVRFSFKRRLWIFNSKAYLVFNREKNEIGIKIRDGIFAIIMRAFILMLAGSFLFYLLLVLFGVANLEETNAIGIIGIIFLIVAGLLGTGALKNQALVTMDTFITTELGGKALRESWAVRKQKWRYGSIRTENDTLIVRDSPFRLFDKAMLVLFLGGAAAFCFYIYPQAHGNTIVLLIVGIMFSLFALLMLFMLGLDVQSRLRVLQVDETGIRFIRNFRRGTIRWNELAGLREHQYQNMVIVTITPTIDFVPPADWLYRLGTKISINKTEIELVMPKGLPLNSTSAAIVAYAQQHGILLIAQPEQGMSDAAPQ